MELVTDLPYGGREREREREPTFLFRWRWIWGMVVGGPGGAAGGEKE